MGETQYETQEKLPYFLYERGEYQRSISEVFRIFHGLGESQEPPPENLRLLLAGNYYHLGQWNKLLETEENPLAPKPGHPDRLLVLKSMAALKMGEWEVADDYFRKSGMKGESPLQRRAGLERVDVEKAAFYSGILPGSGFLLSGEYTNFAVSLGLNLGFFYGTLHYLREKKYALSFLFFFFNVQWYQGGIRGSRESAQNFNLAAEKKLKDEWLRKHEKVLWEFKLDFE